jgi:signal transduction histidine kinase
VAIAHRKIQRYLERAEHQISVQNRLTSDLIDVSRIRAGKLELHMQPCDLGQIVREIVENQRQVAEGRVITLELPTEKMVICGDADRLGQVVSNYLTNALKYSSSDKPVEVAVTTDGATARVTVSDQGAGLTLDEQERVWERFYRAKDVQVLSGNGIGLGLGLHICKTIVEQHSGCVGLHSMPGKGSHFWFTLSLSEALIWD